MCLRDLLFLGLTILWTFCFVLMSFLNVGRGRGRGSMGKVSEGKEEEGPLFMSNLYAQELMLFTPGYCHKYNIWPQLRASAA